jgi:hypothetical protein
MYFGYVLVNEPAASIGKALSDIQEDVRTMNQNLALLRPGFYANGAFQRDVVPRLDALQNQEPGAKYRELRDKVVNSVENSRRTGDIATLADVMRSALGEVSSTTDCERRFSTALSAASNSLSRFIATQAGAAARISAAIKDLAPLISKAETRLEKPENRTPEILKRLAIGLAVASFFMVILRYTSGLYRLNYQQELRTMEDEDTARKFYVGFKGSDSWQQRKAVLTAFLANSGSGCSGTSAASEGDRISKDELGIFKEIVAALAKKL